jgi:hypothetical protein
MELAQKWGHEWYQLLTSEYSLGIMNFYKIIRFQKRFEATAYKCVLILVS